MVWIVRMENSFDNPIPTTADVACGGGSFASGRSRVLSTVRELFFPGMGVRNLVQVLHQIQIRLRSGTGRWEADLTLKNSLVLPFEDFQGESS